MENTHKIGQVKIAVACPWQIMSPLKKKKKKKKKKKNWE